MTHHFPILPSPSRPPPPGSLPAKTTSSAHTGSLRCNAIPTGCRQRTKKRERSRPSDSRSSQTHTVSSVANDAKPTMKEGWPPWRQWMPTLTSSTGLHGATPTNSTVPRADEETQRRRITERPEAPRHLRHQRGLLARRDGAAHRPGARRRVPAVLPTMRHRAGTMM